MRISDWSSDVCSSDLPTTTGLRQTRTTACCEGQAALGTRIRSLNFQPVASDGLALAASTKRARGWQLGLVRTTANLYGSTAWPVNAPSMRAQASGIWRRVWTTPLACGVAAGRVISGTGSAAKAGSAASSRSGRIGRRGAYTGAMLQRLSPAGGSVVPGDTGNRPTQHQNP